MWKSSGGGSAPGTNQSEGRPALIVSNDRFNKTSDTLEVVYLTHSPRNDQPTHVTVRSGSSESVAICEQVTSVRKDRFISYISSATKEEMVRIDMALLTSLDLSLGGTHPAPTATKEPTNVTPIPASKQPTTAASGRDWEAEYMDQKEKYESEIAKLKAELIRAQSEADIFKGLYTDMTDRAMGRAVNA